MLDCPRSTPGMQPAQPSRKAHANKKSAARCPWSIHSAPQRKPRTPMRLTEPRPPLRLEALPSYCRHHVLSDSYVLCFEQIRAVFAASPLLSHRFTKPRGGGYPTSYSSNRYSPKSHTAVKKITSNAIRKASQSHRSMGFSANSAAVASVLAISSGVSNGNSSSGSNNSRIRACAEIADSVVPVTESPKLPRNSTNASCGTTPSSGTLYSTAKIGSSSSSVINRNNVLAHSLDRKIANGSDTERRNALSVSLVCSRKNPGCSISDAAKRNAIHSNPGPNRRDSSRVGSNVKLNSTTTIKIKTTVVVSSSRERNSVRSSLPSSTEVLENRLIYALAKVRIERRLAPFCVSATTVPASRRIPRVASAEISDSPCRLIKIVEPAPWRRHNVSANQLAPCGSSPVDGSSRSNTDGSCSSARAMATRWRIPRENVRTKESRRSNKPTSCSSDSTRLAGSGIPSSRANSSRFSSAVSSS